MDSGAGSAVESEEGAQRRPLGPAQEQLLGRGGRVDVLVAADVAVVAVGPADRPVEHVRGQRGESPGPAEVGVLVAREVRALVGGGAGRPAVPRAREEEQPAPGVRALVGVEDLARHLVVDDRIAVVHGGAGLTVGEVHVDLHLLAEVLHESVGPEIEYLADPARPPADRRRIGEVDQRRGAAREVALEQVGLAGGGGGDVAVIDGVLIGAGVLGAGAVVGDEGAEVDQGVDTQPVQRVDLGPQLVAREQRPALDAIAVERQLVTGDVG